jgi:hypothetical protein
MYFTPHWRNILLPRKYVHYLLRTLCTVLFVFGWSSNLDCEQNGEWIFEDLFLTNVFFCDWSYIINGVSHYKFFLDKLNARFRRKLSNSIYLNLCCCLHSLYFFKNNIIIINMYIKCASLYLQVLILMCYFSSLISIYPDTHISLYNVDFFMWDSCFPSKI